MEKSDALKFAYTNTRKACLPKSLSMKNVLIAMEIYAQQQTKEKEIGSFTKLNNIEFKHWLIDEIKNQNYRFCIRPDKECDCEGDYCFACHELADKIILKLEDNNGR